MLISNNPEPANVEFGKLLGITLETLNTDSKKNEKEYLKLLGNKLEDKIFDVMSNMAIGTPFENSIELISGQKFPDIIAKKFYGVEVKSTKQNHWRTTGNSVLESTRVEGIERIFMMFGKIFSPIEFKCRPYEDCLSEVVVTHSPRYLIDMDLTEGKTIFDKINIPYDTLRKETNPIKPITEYYRQFLKPGEEVWWLDQDETQSSSLIIKLWNNLTATQKKNYLAKAMALFPTIFSNKSSKFNQVAVWLVNTHSIVCPNMRDLFTAGGTGTVLWGNQKYDEIPKVIVKMINILDDVFEALQSFDNQTLENNWDSQCKDKLNDWIDLVVENSNYMRLPFNLNDFLKSKANLL